ncbi:MAG: hypothetical protein Q9182_007430 [Xanthomendoza sp. 2 TL-2023]
MLIDDETVLHSPHAYRRQRLEDLVSCLRGRAIVSKRKTVDFSSKGGPEKLRTLFATAITYRWEGLVLKPSDEPYFGSRRTSGNAPVQGWIKLKKDYIPGLGDSADFAVVGAGYNASRAAQLRSPNLIWTHFHLGCLRNKTEVKEKKARPYFVVIGALEVNLEMTKHLNQHGQYYKLPFGSLKSFQDPFIINISKSVPSMDVLFRKPFVIDVVGAGFEKEANRDYFTLRFPRALKLHSDRDWEDSVSFDELQEMAKLAATVPAETKPEVARWEQQLDEVDRGVKGSHVPWDLSEDDIHLPELTVGSTSRASRRRPSVAPPMIRMDTGEMTDQEKRLDSGEVVENSVQHTHTSNWSSGNLPTPPKSSPVEDLRAAGGRQALASIQASDNTDKSSTPYSRQALSSIQSTESTPRPRRRSSEDGPGSQERGTPKRRRVCPLREEKEGDADTSAGIQFVANSKAPKGIQKPDQASVSKPFVEPKLPSSSSAKEVQQPGGFPTSEPFLVPKLATGTAEALRSRTQARTITDMERTSPDRQTTEDEASSQGLHSTQQSLTEEWQLHEAKPMDIADLLNRIPDLVASHVVLSPDVAGMPYLTEDLLGPGLATHSVRKVFGETARTGTLELPLVDGHHRTDVIILIEGRRHDSSLEMLKYLIGRTPADRSHNLWVFDWRFAEDVIARRLGRDHGEQLLRNRLAAGFWYGVDGELRWLSETLEVQSVSWKNIEESRGMSGAFLDVRYGLDG